ncbi:ankyrin repeat-containing protein ITN1-like [Malus sylvestris]|uniref:ankyrin repeat-containing protein ITN1-like n=1 Tax=Malus sylvestris TaxID=3752 RepID=UPI0021ABFE58|nr:ankyrin repeat-containing protein ITN1-like [Malus sylvestris]XP_050146055.1 ankyrin repeat-containing protein ITN1-like [Malus sylvestris]XP_050146056.1 ankyrin repeat-containing protein ITN1-like [Malus sylvestris]XP_050146057.1 ankyrin repeat-containing protein ITN1-like [Malus sylvestris]XP_050146058.1 ankyrin repeat-containing protein ITN1-like [Malus sylvestris]XP_050146059.1 ankyrin repeat-containing protein ITN1-like [Malus sylvestris]XP_050146060.1 ankyrin repeat-containing protei
MNPSLYEAAATGDVGFLEGLLTADLSQKTPKENNILHIAAEFKQINFFKKVKKIPESPRFWATNKNGETPLHVAARVGCGEVVTFLIEHIKAEPMEVVDLDPEKEPTDGEAYKKLLRMPNLEMDTALHVAVRYNHAGVAKILLSADPELCCSFYSTKESPLFLAVRAGSTSIADYILKKTPDHESLSFQGTNGVTALHAAATRIPFAKKGIVQSMVTKNPGMVEVRDEIGWTPLHYASLRGNLKAAQLLIQNYKTFKFACYIKDELGMSALHVAAYAGHTQIIEELIQRCPDICDCVNHKGQTALHAAVLGEKINVVKYVLKTPRLARLINEADNDGNTPWHLAAIHENSEIVAILRRDRRLNRTAINKEFLQVSDILLAENTGRKEIVKSRNVLNCLARDVVVTVPYYQQKIKQEFKKFGSQGESSTSETPVNTKNTRENLQAYLAQTFNRNDSKLLVATVIATVTFSAVLNPPGGFTDDGTPVLTKKGAYKVFMFFNTLCFALSVSAIFNEYSPISVLSTHLPTPTSLISYSIAGMLAAFYAALIAVEPMRPRQSMVNYFLFGNDGTVVASLLSRIGAVIACVVVGIPIFNSLSQILNGETRIHDLKKHII